MSAACPSRLSEVGRAASLISLGISTLLCGPDASLRRAPAPHLHDPRPARGSAFADNLHEDLAQLPLPMGPRPHSIYPSLADFSGKHRANPIPPKTDGFVAHVDLAFMQKVLDISKRERKPDIQHHRWADDFRRCFEITEWTVSSHPKWLADRPARLKSVFV